MTERKSYIVGVIKIPFEERDVAHRYITPEDDRNFMEILGADVPDDDYLNPVGSKCMYRVSLTEEEAEEFRSASNCRYVEEEPQYTLPIVLNKTDADLPPIDIMRFLEEDFPRNDLWHGRDVTFALIDGWTSAGARASIEATIIERSPIFGDAPYPGEEQSGDHADLTMGAMCPRGGSFLDVNATVNTGTQSSPSYGMGGAPVIAATLWAVNHGARVCMISAQTDPSSGPPTPTQAEMDMGQYLQDRGVLCFVAAGNFARANIGMPSRLSVFFSNWHSVGAWNVTDTGTGSLSTFSNHSAEMTGVAPGESINSLIKDGTIAEKSGTSYSSPAAARVAVRALTGGRFSPEQVGAAMKANMRTLGQPASTQGGGAFSLLKTLQGLGAMTGTTQNAGGPYVNLSPNPTANTVTTGWVAGGSGSRATGLPAIYYEGRDTGFTGTSNILTPKAAVTVGAVYTHGATVRNDVAASVVVGIRWFNSGGTLISTTNTRTIPWTAAAINRVAVTGTAPATATTSAMYVTTSSGTLTMAAHMANAGANAYPYFDGFSTDATWSGGAGLSTSTRSFSVPAEVLRYNLCPNPSFEVDTTGYSTTSVKAGTTVTAPARNSSVLAGYNTFYGSINITGNGTPNSTPDLVLVCPDSAVQAGYTYVLSMHFKHQIFNTSMKWSADWLDSSLNVISTSVSPNTQLLQVNDWSRYYASFVAPSGAVWCRPKVQYFGSTSTANQSLRFDGCMVERASTLSRYFDGNEVGATWTGTANKSTSYIGTDTTVPPPAPVTEINGPIYDGATASLSHNITVPTGVTTAMTGLVCIATGSSNPAVTTLTKTGGGGTFTKIIEQNATNMRVAIWSVSGIAAGNVMNLALSTSESVTVGHYWQDGWTYDDIAAAIRTVSAATTTTGSQVAATGQKLMVIGMERTTAATTVSSVVSSGGETVTQRVYGEGTGNAQSSVYIGYFNASADGARTATITYSNSSANGFAATLTTLGGGTPPGGGGGGTVVNKPGVVHNIGKTDGKNHFNLGVGYVSGHVDKTENQLAAGFEIPDSSAGPCYFTKADGQTVVMSVPLDGGRTSTNTKYPRVEYRELALGGSGDSDTPKPGWNGGSDEHYLTGRTRVVKIQPNKPEVVVGQIHGPSDDTCKMKWRGTGSSAVMVVTLDDADYQTIATNLSVGTEYQWKMRVLNGDIQIYWVNMASPILTISDAAIVQVDGQYFKAGNYVQSWGGTADSRGSPIDSVSSGPCIIELRDLIMWHTGYAPPSSSSTGAPTVGAGDDATIDVNTQFNRIATETANGATISSRSWKIQSGPSVGTTLDTDASLSWMPTATGTYVLRYSATNSAGTGVDDCIVTVAAPGGGGGGGGGTSPYTLSYPDGIPYPTVGAGTSIVNVSSASALTSALSAASAGQRILLANGTYSGQFTITSKVATAQSGISIEAGTTGSAIFDSGSTLNVNGCQHLTIKGLKFNYDPGSGYQLGFRGASKYCRVTRCTFGPSSLGSAGSTKSNFIYMGGSGSSCEYIRIDHNELMNHANPGNAILGDGDFDTQTAVKHIRIDHNIIRGIKPEVANEKEPIRLGVSTMSRSVSNSVCERNWFNDNLCEPEIISVKACKIRVNGNTFYRNAGGAVIRHGTDSILTDNYIIDGNNTVASAGLKSGGIRFYDARHTVSYNYIDGVIGENFQASLLLDSGDAEGTAATSSHFRVIDAMVERNVIVNSNTPIQVGNNYSSLPMNCTVKDNITAGTTVTGPITYLGGSSASTTGTVTNNVNYSTPTAGGFTQDADSIWRKSGYGPRVTFIKQADCGPLGDTGDTDGTGVGISGGGGGGGSAPDVSAGSDASTLLNSAFNRTASETGSGITAREWRITAGPAQQNTILSTSTSLSWTPGTLGVYTLRFSSTNSFGTSSDTADITVTAGGGGGAAVISFVGAGTAGAGASTDMAIPAPDGITAGMFQVACVVSAGDSIINTIPPGWQVMKEITVTSQSTPTDLGGPCKCVVYFNTTGIASSSTWAKTDTRFWHGVRLAWTGQTGLGQNLAVATATGSPSASHVTPAVTPTRPSSLVVGVIMSDLLNANPGPFTAPSGWTMRYNADKVQGTEHEAIAVADVTAGAVSTSGTFIGINADETGRFAFVLEGALLEQIMIPISIP